ncbi:MAG: glycosyl hydrolase, partial [Cyanothece sp. SIO2G6]|nr:glycosyl hydrolase [Cyanothece sp. SIO2G6]
YALANGTRPLDLSVNGQVVDRIEFTDTMSWEDWDLLTRSLNLDTGLNTIRLTATGRSGGDFDYLEVSRTA